MLSQQPAPWLLIERESKARAAGALGEFHLEEGGGLESPTSPPPRSGTQAEGPLRELPGLLGVGGRAQSVLTDDTSSNPLLPSMAPLTPSAAAQCPSCCR